MALLPEIRSGFRAWREYLGEGISDEELAVFTDVMDRIARRAAAWCGRIVMEEET